MTKLSNVKDLTPNQNTIHMLKRLLGEAEEGKLRSLAYVAAYEDQVVCSGWSVDGRSSERLILAEMLVHQHDFTTNICIMDGDTILANALKSDW